MPCRRIFRQRYPLASIGKLALSALKSRAATMSQADSLPPAKPEAIDHGSGACGHDRPRARISPPSSASPRGLRVALRCRLSRCCLFSFDSAIVTDLDVALRAHLPGARDIGVLVPVPILKRSTSSRQSPDVRIERAPKSSERPFRLSIDGACLLRSRPGATSRASRRSSRLGEPVARAKFGTLEPVLVAASTDEARQGDVRRLLPALQKPRGRNERPRPPHPRRSTARTGATSWSRGRPSSSSRTSARPPEPVRSRSDFFEHQAVFRVGRFEVASRLETEKFPAWEEVLPKESKYELRLSKCALLEALDQIGAAIGERSRGIRLRRTAEGLEIHGENPDAGSMTIARRGERLEGG